MANDNSISSDLIRGHIDTIILRSLYDGDKNGNEICLDIDDKSGGQYEIKQPTLYSALKRLETSGFVKSYWASGDVGRRRYYKLTDDGKQICEDNFNSWIHSRNIIDKLISDGKNLGYPEFVVEESRRVRIPSDDTEEYQSKEEQSKFDVSEYENYTFNPSPEIEEDNSENDDFTENSDYFSDGAPVVKSIDDSDYETKVNARKNEKNLNDLLDSDTDEFSVTQLSLIDEAEKNEETEENSAEETQAEEIAVTEDEPTEEAVVSPEETEENEDSGEDDYLEYERYNAPDKKYSDILEAYFPSPSKSENDDYDEEEQQADEPQADVESKNGPSYDDFEVKTSTITVEPERIEPEEQIKRVEQPKKEAKNASEIDYSDIISIAAEQGFKVKTADRTNHADKGRLYINRLVALSSTVLFVLLSLELLFICMPLNDILGFAYNVFLTGLAVLFIFPLITYVVVLFAPNKTVDRLPTMKYCVTASIVTVLNLFLLTFAITLILQVDLYDAKSLLEYIIIPFVIYLNIPLYFIIKYAFVSGRVFFAKE